VNATTLVEAPPLQAPAVEPPEEDLSGLAEEHRWMRFLLPPFVVAAAFFALAIGTDSQWPMVFAFVLGALPVIFAFVYLALSSALRDEP